MTASAGSGSIAGARVGSSRGQLTQRQQQQQHQRRHQHRHQQQRWQQQQDEVSKVEAKASSPLVRLTPVGSGHGVTARALRYLIEATYDACNAALGEGAYVGHTVVPETGQTSEREQAADLVVAIETARAAAAMVEGLMSRAAQRRASYGAQVLS